MSRASFAPSSCEVPDDAMQVAVLQLEHLVEPVHQLDIRIAAQLAEDGGALDRLVQQRVQLAEQRDTADFAHAVPPGCGAQFRIQVPIVYAAVSRAAIVSCTSTRSSASVRLRASAQPRRPAQPPGAAQARARDLVAPQHQSHVPRELDADVVAQPREHLRERARRPAGAIRSRPATADRRAAGTCPAHPAPARRRPRQRRASRRSARRPAGCAARAPA